MTREELKAIVHVYGDPNGEGTTDSVMEAVDKYVLSLGVQSPAPDEKDSEIHRLREGIRLVAGWYSLKSNPDSGDIRTIEILQELISNAPSAGKGPEKENLKKHIAHLEACNNKLFGKLGDYKLENLLAEFPELLSESPKVTQKELLNLEREKSAKLIEALEAKMDRLGEKSIDWNSAFHPVQAVLEEMRDLIATYKGKEAKEGRNENV